MWEESTRVGGGSIEATVAFSCDLERGAAFARLFDQDAILQVIVAPGAAAARLAAVKNVFGIEPTLRGEGVTVFEATDQRVSVAREAIWGADLLFQLSRFGPFRRVRGRLSTARSTGRGRWSRSDCAGTSRAPSRP
jgi:hypothetical protein